MKPSWLGSTTGRCSTTASKRTAWLVLSEVELLARSVDERRGDPSGVRRSIEVLQGQRTLEQSGRAAHRGCRPTRLPSTIGGSCHEPACFLVVMALPTIEDGVDR